MKNTKMSKAKKSTPIAPKSTKIGKGNIQSLIKEEAEVIKRKKEIYEQIKSFNKELGELNKKGLGKLGLNERVMMVGAQGFGGAGASAHPTGFVYPQNISRVAELEAEMAPDEPVVLDKAEGNVIGDPEGKPLVDDEVKKQLIDMKEKLEMILSSIGGGVATGDVEVVTTTPGGEAAQAAAQTEEPEDEKEEIKDEEEAEGDDNEEETEDKDEEEEIVIKENKTKKQVKKK